MLRNVWDQVTTKVPGEERFMRRLVDDAGTPDGYAALVDTFAAGPSPHSLMGRFDEALNFLSTSSTTKTSAADPIRFRRGTFLRPSSTRSGVGPGRF